MRRAIVGCLSAVLFMAMAGAGLGAALDQKVVSANAKWLIHADIESLKAGKLGSALFKHLQAGALAQLTQGLKGSLGVNLDFNKVTAITAYGSDFESGEANDGVVLIRSGQDLKSALESLVKEPKEEVKVTRSTEGGLDLFAVNDDVFVTQLPGNVLVASQTSKSILLANEVFSGKGSNLAAQDSFSGYTHPPKTVLLVMAQGFQKQKQIAGPLEVLKQAQGLQLALGEVGDKLQLEIMLKTADKESSDQVSGLVNGMLALFKLNQADPDLAQLMNSALVKSTDRAVSLSVSFPIEQALKKLAEESSESP